MADEVKLNYERMEDGHWKIDHRFAVEWGLLVALALCMAAFGVALLAAIVGEGRWSVVFGVLGIGVVVLVIGTLVDEYFLLNPSDGQLVSVHDYFGRVSRRTRMSREELLGVTVVAGTPRRPGRPFPYTVVLVDNRGKTYAVESTPMESFDDQAMRDAAQAMAMEIGVPFAPGESGRRIERTKGNYRTIDEVRWIFVDSPAYRLRYLAFVFVCVVVASAIYVILA